MYEDKIVDRLFNENENHISREQFISAIEGNVFDFAEEFKDGITNIIKGKKFRSFKIEEDVKQEQGVCADCIESIEDGSADWMFNPQKLRFMFRYYYRKYEKIDE